MSEAACCAADKQSWGNLGRQMRWLTDNGLRRSVGCGFVDQTTADGVRRQHAPAVLANEVFIEQRWGRSCVAYNVQIRPGPAGAAALSAVQEDVLRLEPSLLRVPAPALHANVSWLLPVHGEFGRPKDDLWRQHGPGWMAVVARAVSGTRRFRLRYRRLVATDSAIIAVAEEPNPVSALRRELTHLLRVPGGRSAGDLVHTTLFRYAQPLRDPSSLTRWLATATIHADAEVTEVLVVREHVFPSLEYEIIRRLPLPA